MLGAFPRYLISGIYMVLSFASLDVPAVTLAVLPIFLGALLFHCLGRVNLFSLFSSFDFILKQNPSSAPSISWSCSLSHNIDEVKWVAPFSPNHGKPTDASIQNHYTSFPLWCIPYPATLILRDEKGCWISLFPKAISWFRMFLECNPTSLPYLQLDIFLNLS